MKIPAWNSFKYCEIWKITERRGDSVYKTINTGKCVTNALAAELCKNQTDYQAISIAWSADTEIDIDLITDLSYFT